MSSHAHDAALRQSPSDLLFFTGPSWKPHSHVNHVGYGGQLRKLHTNPIPAKAIAARLPASISWSDFPYFSMPEYHLLVDKGSHWDSQGITAEELVASLQRQSVIAYDERSSIADMQPDAVLEARARVGTFLKRIAPEASILVRHNSSKGAKTDTPEMATRRLVSSASVDFVEMTTDEMISSSGGKVYLDYNYVFNGGGILKPLFTKHISISHLTAPDTAGWNYAVQAARLYANLYTRFGAFHFHRKPMLLQFLYALQDIDHETEQALYDAMGSMDIKQGLTVGSSLKCGKWVGSGKYAAFDVALPFSQFLTSAWALGLISVDHQKLAVALSEPGHAILRALHKFNRDPDILSRFHASGSTAINVGEIERVEDCLRRFFKKAKTKLSGQL